MKKNTPPYNFELIKKNKGKGVISAQPAISVKVVRLYIHYLTCQGTVLKGLKGRQASTQVAGLLYIIIFCLIC